MGHNTTATASLLTYRSGGVLRYKPRPFRRPNNHWWAAQLWGPMPCFLLLLSTPWARFWLPQNPFDNLKMFAPLRIESCEGPSQRRVLAGAIYKLAVTRINIGNQDAGKGIFTFRFYSVFFVSCPTVSRPTLGGCALASAVPRFQNTPKQLGRCSWQWWAHPPFSPSPPSTKR